MDFYEKLLSFKSENDLTYKHLGVPIDLKEDAMRMAMKNRKLNTLQIKELTRYFKLGTKFEDPVFESVKDLKLKEKIVEFGQFFSENEKEVLKNPTILNIIEKQVAKRILKLTQDRDALQKFLND